MYDRTFSNKLISRFEPKDECTAVHSAGSWLFDLSPKSKVRPYIQQVDGYSIGAQSRMYGHTFSRLLVIRLQFKVECTAVHSAGGWLFDFSSNSNVRPYIQQVVGYLI